MSTARASCPNCQLPYYTDRNSECPYCGTLTAADESTSRESTASDGTRTGDSEPEASAAVDTSPAGSVASGTPPSRPRTVCSHCGLTHYADDNNGCPYCAMAGHDHSAAAAKVDATGEAGAKPNQPAASTGEPTTTTTAPDGAETATGDQSSGGLLSRLRNLFS